MIEQRIEEICRHVAAAHRAEIEFRYERRYPATINTEKETGFAAAAATALPKFVADAVGLGLMNPWTATISPL